MLTLKLQEVINMYLPSKNPYIIQQIVINENTQTDQVEVVVLIQPWSLVSNLQGICNI